MQAPTTAQPPYITYQLTIQVIQATTITVGKLGCFEIDAGMYLYTGSAKQHYEARIARHLRHQKKMHWHIDYLLDSPHASVIHVSRHTESECLINQRAPGKMIIQSFGATDCTAGCGSHLKYQTVD